MGSPADDRAALFRGVYEHCYGAIYAYAARRVGASSADEVAAETFLIAWRRMDALPVDPLPWLYGVARNVVLRHWVDTGRQQRVRSVLGHERLPTPPGLQDESGDWRLWEAWEHLADADREVLALVAWEDLRVSDAARVLGCSAPVFSVRLHRARRRLARLLAAHPRASEPALSEVR